MSRKIIPENQVFLGMSLVRFLFAVLVVVGLGCEQVSCAQDQSSGTRESAKAVESRSQPEGIKIRWENRFLTVRKPGLPGEEVRIHYLEAYCRPGSTDRRWSPETVIPHQSKLVQSSGDGKLIVLEDRLEDGVIVTHRIIASVDEVTFTLQARNPTNKESQAHWAQPCMRVDGFTGTDPKDSREVYPPYIQKCFIMLDGKLTRLPTEPWALDARYTPGQVYAPEHVDRNDVNPRPLSKLIPSSALTGCFSKDETMVLAIAWEPYQEVFQGVITCMHCDFRIGGLAPGEEKTIRGKLYILPADEQALLKRFSQDFGKSL